MFDEISIRETLGELAADFLEEPFEDGRRMTDQEAWEHAKDKLITSIKEGDESYEFINSENGTEEFRKAQALAIEFIGGL